MKVSVTTMLGYLAGASTTDLGELKRIVSLKLRLVG